MGYIDAGRHRDLDVWLLVNCDEVGSNGKVPCAVSVLHDPYIRVEAIVGAVLRTP